METQGSCSHFMMVSIFAVPYFTLFLILEAHNFLDCLFPGHIRGATSRTKGDNIIRSHQQCSRDLRGGQVLGRRHAQEALQ